MSDTPDERGVLVFRPRPADQPPTPQDPLAVIYQKDATTPPEMYTGDDVLPFFEALTANHTDVYLVQVLINASIPGWRPRWHALRDLLALETDPRALPARPGPVRTADPPPDPQHYTAWREFARDVDDWMVRQNMPVPAEQEFTDGAVPDRYLATALRRGWSAHGVGRTYGEQAADRLDDLLGQLATARQLMARWMNAALALQVSPPTDGFDPMAPEVWACNQTATLLALRDRVTALEEYRVAAEAYIRGATADNWLRLEKAKLELLRFLPSAQDLTGPTP